MSFLDDLKSFLDSTLGAPSPSRTNPLAGVGTGALGDLNLPQPRFSPEGPSATGISNSDLSELETWPDQQRSQDPATLAGLIQNRKAAFNVIDITPGNFVSSKFQANNLNKLFDKVGHDGDFLLTGGGDNTLNSNWRQLTFTSTPGNFLSFHFNNSPINKPRQAASVVASESLQTNLTDPNTLFANNNVDPGKAGTFAVPFIFVQFDDSAAPLLMLHDGDELEVTFNSLSVFFKWYSFPFSLIIGNGSKFSKKGLEPFNPAFSPSYHVNSKSRHCTSFCFCNGDQTPNGANSIIAANTQSQIVLFDPRNVALQAPNGVCVGWITNIMINAFGTATGTFQADFSILNTGGHLYTCIPFLQQAPTTLNGPIFNPINTDFSTPVRFCLFNDPNATVPRNDRLVFQVNTPAGNPGNLLYKFSIHGYFYGIIGASGRVATPFQWPVEMLTNMPYPNDYGTKISGF